MLQAATKSTDRSDEELRQGLVGTWELDFPAKSFPLKKVFSTYRADRTFEQLVVVEIGASGGRISVKGKWRVEYGTIIEVPTKAGNPKLIGLEARTKIMSISREVFLARTNAGMLEMRRSRVPAKLPKAADWISAMSLQPQEIKSFALEKPEPTYPHVAHMQRIEGNGWFKLRMNKAGRVDSVQTVQSTGSALLDQAAISALMRWRFKPGAVKELMMPIVFTLNGH